MPIQSEAQRRAMWAAEEGHSTLGIPRDVAEKFLAGDAAPVKGHAAGIIHVARDGSILLLKRGGQEGVDNFVGYWGLPGGSCEEGEAPAAAAHREAIEEMGYDGRGPMKLFDQVRTPNNMAFHTFVRPVQKFTPKLNHEHTAHTWANLDDLPEPMHPALVDSLQKIPTGRELFDWSIADGDLAQDSVHEACGGRGCPGCGGSGVSPITYAPMKPGLANDELSAVLLEEIGRQYRELVPSLAFDRAPDGIALDRHGVVVTLAFDKQPEHKPEKQQKSSDDFERLHVKRVPITKACVNPYYGREIPNAESLGLDPNKVYWLLRDPSEIRKAAPTFHNIPLLSKHVPHSADQHDGDIIVGNVGSEAVYEHPYLYNSLAIWSREGLHYAEGDQKELSSAYLYDADMTPGVYEGQRYDGVMRNMKGNHVCMVKKGRAGSDIALDEALNPNKETTMSKTAARIQSLRAGVALGAVRAHLLVTLPKTKLAQDAAIPDLSTVFAAAKPGKFTDAIPKIITGVRAALKGKLAQDADLPGIVSGVEQLLKAVDGDKTVADAEIDVEPSDMEDPETGELDPDEPVMDGSCEAIAAYLKEKGVPDDIIAGMPGMAEPAADGPTDVMQQRLQKGAKDKDIMTTENGPDGKEKKPITQQAMDAAIAAARKDTIAQMQGVEAARKHVRPQVGEIEMAFDSAAGVYQQAFKMIGKPDKAKHTDAKVLKDLWDMVPTGQQQLAQDSAVEDDEPKTFAERFPNAGKRKRIA